MGERMRRIIGVVCATIALVVAFPVIAGAQSTFTVYGWGHYFGRTPISLNPSSGPFTQVTQMVTTNTDTYVLANGQVWAAGVDMNGELGDGPPPSGQTTVPTMQLVDLPSGVTITSLAPVGPNGTEIAIDDSGDSFTGTAWGWGLDSFGQLCLGNTDEVDTPVELPFTGVTFAAGAGDHATYDASYESKGAGLYSCGGSNQGDHGDLGDNSTSPSLKPVRVATFTDHGVTDNSPVTAMTASWSDEGVILADGTYWNWGFNKFGQLGNNSKKDSPVPVKVPLASVQSVSEGGGADSDGQTMALLSDGSYWGWGDDISGQLCDEESGSKNFYKVPTQITPTPPEVLSSVASGGTTGYLLTTTSNLYACGDNSNGQIGNGHKSKHPVTTPQPVLAGDNVTQVSSTNYNASAVVDG
jgi:alpha-tubulin suppressor-like RCC1 family protein